MSPKLTVLADAKVFIGDGDVLEKASVLIADGVIERVANGEIKPPKNAVRISLAGGALLPGLIDCHTHIALDGGVDPFTNSLREPLAIKALKAARNAEKTLLAGVTTIRDMGAADGTDLDVRNAVLSGLIRGPRILASGRAICVTGGHGWPIGREADGADAVRQAVREQIKAGADTIKFMVTGGAMTPGSDPVAEQMTKEELEAGVAEAHKAGKRTAAHAKGEKGILLALRAGIDSVEHATVLTEEAIALARRQGTFMVFTLSALYNMERAGTKAGIPAYILEKALLYKPRRRQSVDMARNAGVPMAMGTDAGTPFNPHGDNPRELERLVEIGYSPTQALIAATSAAARALGLENRLGTVAEGKAADLLAVNGDPLKNIGVLSDPLARTLVMKGGDIAFRGKLRRKPGRAGL